MSFTISSKSFKAFCLPYVFISAFKTALSKFFIDIMILLSVYLKKYLQDRSKFVFYKKYFCIKEGYFYQLYR